MLLATGVNSSKSDETLILENANVMSHLSETFPMLSACGMSIELLAGNTIRLARMCYLISIMEILLAAKGGVVWTCVTAIKCPGMLALLLNHRLPDIVMFVVIIAERLGI